jgi:splicing factor U2AF subunit
MDSSVVMLGNLVSETDLVGDAAYNDVCEDVMEECSRSGKVIELRIPRDLIDSTVKCNAFVKFASVAEAKAAVALFHGRKFDGRSVSAVLWPEEGFDKLPPNRAK